jgi:hypothetical protein
MLKTQPAAHSRRSLRSTVVEVEPTEVGRMEDGRGEDSECADSGERSPPMICIPSIRKRKLYWWLQNAYITLPARISSSSVPYDRPTVAAALMPDFILGLGPCRCPGEAEINVSVDFFGPG